jgi:FkbM family methyltransferase
MDDSLPFGGRRLVVYGLGATGERVVRALVERGVRIDALIDARRGGEVLCGAPVVSPSALSGGHWRDADCLVALHNHYVPLADVLALLTRVGFRRILGLAGLSRVIDASGLAGGYWLDFGFSYGAHRNELEAVSAVLADDESRHLLKQVVSYRTTGDLAACPSPSGDDEYTPLGLPRFREPVRLIDCGAYDGAALRRFVQAGYRIEHVLAFEPDPANYAALRAGIGPDMRATLLPMAAWSSVSTLRFAARESMASGVTESGELFVQAAPVDEVAVNWAPTLVKMDVEGAELEALRGMEQTIRAHRPDLCLSLYHTPRHLFEIPLLVASWGLGYRFYLRVHEENTFGVVLYALQDRRA